MKPRLAFYDIHELDQAAYVATLSSDFTLSFSPDPLSMQTAALATAAQVVSVHVTSNVTAEVMAGLPHLRHVACRTTGYDNVDLGYARAHDILVTNVPAYGQDTVAEYAFLLLLAVSRKLMLAAHSVHAREVVPQKLTGSQVSGKTLGLIGTGRIGQSVAKIAAGFGMTVLAYDPYPNAPAAAEFGFTYVSLDELLGAADYITLHAPATPETHHLLSGAQFAKMKPGVIIVNTARGSLIDTPALINALQSGAVAGAGLDVLEGEEYLHLTEELNLLGSAKLGDEARQVLGISILHTMPGVLITSHNAYNSKEALARIREITASNITAWHKQKITNQVN